MDHKYDIIKGNNVLIPMTRRYPKLKRKILERDSKIAKKIIKTWDNDHNSKEVLRIYTVENKNLSNERYWELLRTVWIVCGGNEYNELFRIFMRSNRKERHYFSTPEEHEKFSSFPDIIHIYRATNDPDDNGLSWTISKEYAELYKKDYNKKVIIHKTISKDQIFAYIERNNEYEIILL